MKNIKTTLILIISTFLANIIYAQNRENRVNVTFDTVSENLTKAVGWKLNKESGKWIENKNVIWDKKCPSSMVSLSDQNFKWINFSTVLYNNKKHYVFLCERIGGSYKYPNIREGWEPNTNTDFMIIDSLEYQKLKNAIKAKDGNNISISSKIHGSMSDVFEILGGENSYNEENLLMKITNALETKSYTELCLVVNSQKIKWH
jgi:hypothetical protein